MPEVYTAAEKAPPDKKANPDPIKPGEPTSQFVNKILYKTGELPRTELWGAFMVKPDKRFINEQADEETVLLLRAHPITNSKWMLMTIGMLILPQLLTMTGIFDNLGAYTVYVLVGKLAWYLMTLGYAFEKFLDWFYSVLIVTNERIVDIDYINLLTRVVDVAPLNHIEEPSMVAGGFIRSLFNYGDLKIATAAQESNIEALSIPFPEKALNIISELAEALEKERGQAN